MNGCRFEGCTFADTGICALENDPATCPNRTTADEEGKLSNVASVGEPVLQKPEGTESFPRSTTLGTDAVNRLMKSRYVKIVGILGEPESGKTACLVSLYLMLSNARLEGWTYADSHSLMALDESSRGARRWNQGNPPEQMTVHTEMANDRQPGFLHLRLLRNEDRQLLDFILPDLPGEWTQALVRTSTAERLEFLKSAEVIWIVIDGRTLLSKERRHGLINRAGLLAARLQTMFAGAKVPRAILVVSHRDSGEIPAALIERVQAEVHAYGLELESIQVAPFSDHAAVARPGFGLAQLLTATARREERGVKFWPDRQSDLNVRSFLAHRGRA